MRFYLISDNIDTQAGMRLAGIQGVVVHEPEEVEKALDEALKMKDVAVIPPWKRADQGFHYPVCAGRHRS